MPPCNSEMIDRPINRENVRTIFVTRHGESQNNLYGKIGGDAGLTQRGEQYANTLACFINSLPEPCHKVLVSRLCRTHQTAQFIDVPQEVRPELDEINAGEHDNMTYEDIAEKFPVEFARRDEDKLNYRYPQGESYMDVVNRLKPIFDELKTEDNLLIVSHQATIRCLMAILLRAPLVDLPYMKIPLHTIIKLKISDTGISMEYIRMAVDCVDTFRPKPDNCNINRNFEDACLTVPFHL